MAAFGQKRTLAFWSLAPATTAERSEGPLLALAIGQTWLDMIPVRW